MAFIVVMHNTTAYAEEGHRRESHVGLLKIVDTEPLNFPVYFHATALYHMADQPHISSLTRDIIRMLLISGNVQPNPDPEQDLNYDTPEYFK